MKNAEWLDKRLASDSKAVNDWPEWKREMILGDSQEIERVQTSQEQDIAFVSETDQKSEEG